MSSRRLSCVVALAAGAVVLGALPAVTSAGTQPGVSGSGASAGAPLEIVRQSTRADSAQGAVDFSVQFNHTPDFYTIDSFGRPADSFQYEINPDWSGSPKDLQLAFGQFRDVIRGDEIRTSGRLLIRDASTPSNPEPNSGGWGPVVAAVPFHLSGQDLTFSVPLHDLRSKGAFSYNLFTTNFGTTTSQVTGDSHGQSHSVPLPPAAWAGMLTLGGMALAGGAKRLRRRGDADQAEH